ncbi:Rieske (2Fe-2S) protein [Bacteroidales bacterium OttesenSCG-928-L19]|nr:Rieske (2Fe-2S) protein [Bacteroidales bacterium OttesenSCG-928-L19]
MRNTTILFLFLLFFLGSCEYVHETIPNVAVNITIQPNSAAYYQLNHYGGHVYLTGGVSGIIVYRLNDNTFKAYDRACPHDWESYDSWLWVEDSGLTIYDSCCGSRFNIIDGTVINGPAVLPLKYYRANYDGMTLRIRN